MRSLELHGVRELALAETKGRLQVGGNKGVLDGAKDSLVNSLLVGNLRFGKSSLLGLEIRV